MGSKTVHYGKRISKKGRRVDVKSRSELKSTGFSIYEKTKHNGFLSLGGFMVMRVNKRICSYLTPIWKSRRTDHGKSGTLESILRMINQLQSNIKG